MVDKETVIKTVLNAWGGNEIYDGSHVALVKEYCIEHGKPKLQTDLFIQYIAVARLFNECFNIAAEYYIKKYKLILVYDKDNKLINLIDNVRTERQTDCCNQKAV